MILKIDSARPRARPGAHGRAKPTFFGNRLIVCQIAGKNGAEFKNDVDNSFRAHRTPTARPRARQTIFFGNRLIVCQITGKNGAEFKNDVENRFCGRAGARARPWPRQTNFFCQ